MGPRGHSWRSTPPCPLSRPLPETEPGLSPVPETEKVDLRGKKVPYLLPGNCRLPGHLELDFLDGVRRTAVDVRVSKRQD